MRSYRIFPPSFMFWTCQSNQSRMRCKFAKHQLAFLHVVESAFLCFYVFSVNAFYLMLHRAGMRISFQIQEVPRKVSRISSGKLIASERFFMLMRWQVFLSFSWKERVSQVLSKRIGNSSLPIYSNWFYFVAEWKISPLNKKITAHSLPKLKK